MKKFQLFILLSIFCWKISSAQTYHPFPDSLAHWSEVGVTCPFWEPGDLCSTYSWLFSLGHDTMIDNNQYTLVGYNLTGYSTWVLGGQTVSVENYSYQLPGEIFGAIREDSNGKVWYRKLDEILQPIFCAATYIGSSDSDVLLYDFNVTIGDTLPWKFDHNVVQTIDSFQLITGEWRRKIVFCSNCGAGTDDFWIEGIGSSLGFFGSYQSTPFEGGCLLSCFEQNDSLLYSPFYLDSTFECSKFYTPVAQIKVEQISVSPNPSNDFFIFNLGKISSLKSEITIYNSEGKLLRNFSSVHSTQLKIPVSEIGADGIYFYTVKVDEENIFSGKFLIQR